MDTLQHTLGKLAHYRDVHKKTDTFFYDFHRPKRRKDDFADIKR